MIYLFIENLSRLVGEWAERRRDPHDRHICTLIAERW